MVGTRIKQLRLERALTQKDLAEKLCVSYQTISKWENGTNEPDITTLTKLASIFEVSLDSLITGKEEPKENNPSEPEQKEKKEMKKQVSKFPWKVFIAACTEIASFLTIAYIVLLIYYNAVGNVTDRVTGMFDYPIQVILFAFDVAALVALGLFVYLAIDQEKRFKKLTLVKEGRKTKAPSPTAMGVVASSSFILFLVAMIGGTYAFNNRSSVNAALGIEETKKIGGEKTYFESDYLKDDGKTIDGDALTAAGMSTIKEVADEGAVLLWNNNDALPLKKQSKVSLFGMGQQEYILSGFGNHSTYALQTKDLKTVLEGEISQYQVNQTLWDKYADLDKNGYGESQGQGTATADPYYNGTYGYLDQRYREYKVNEPNWTTLGTATSTVSEYKDAAIMIISRDGSEDGDTWFKTNECLDNTYLDLSNEEADILENLKSLKDSGSLSKIIVVLNTKVVIQMKNLMLDRYGVDACLFSGVNGVNGYNSLASILVGDTNPSGALVDVMAYDIDSAPSTENTGSFKWTESTGLQPSSIGVYNDFYLVYQEGIYVGYRYYETRYEDLVLNQGSANSAKGVKAGTGSWSYQNEVAFPFGYGLSYTNFSFSGFKVTRDNDETQGGTYKVTVSVTNTGEVAGKTPIQVYLQKPYTGYDKTTGIEKASVELVGFTKSELIEPSETKTYTIDVKGSEFKTYDAYGYETYILENGSYYLAVGSDSHDALNNILALKGYTSANGMVDSRGKATDGKAALAKEFALEEDLTTYSKSEWTGYDIKNQLTEQGDINKYAGTADQKITYLSRSNWQKTYPSPVSLKCTNAQMVSDMQYGHTAPSAEGIEMPKMGETTVDPTYFDQFADLRVKKLKLIMLRGLDYNDPLWEDLLNELTWNDLNMLTSGGYLNLHGVTSITAPSGASRDGTFGVILNGVAAGLGYPASNVVAQTWNTELTGRMGRIIGNECLKINISQLYGPSADMHRNPYGGRNAEYYSEDPFISGKMLAAECDGIESKGIMVCAKHFVFNDQEINRCGVATFLNEQTAREIYLKTWEIGLNEAKVSSIMSSFPRFGTIFVGSCKGLFTEILRNEWTFKGFVETDSAFDQPYMTSAAARAEAIVAGVNFWMDGGSSMHLAGYVNNAAVVRGARDAAHHMLYSYVNSAIMNGISSTTKIVEITPWWISAVSALRITTGIITGLTTLGFIAALVFYILKRKELVAVYEIEAVEEPFIKKTTKPRYLVSLVTTVMTIAFVAIFLSTQLTSVIKNPPSEATIIYDTAQTYSLGGTDEKVYTNGPKDYEEDCIGLNAETINNEVEIVFQFNCSADIEADVSINISKTSYARRIMDTYVPYLNGKAVMTNATTTVGEVWFDYDEISLFTIKLQKGVNTISFLYTEHDSMNSLNFRELTLVTKAKIDWLQASPVKYEKLNSYTFNAIDYRVVTNSAKNSNENCVGAYYVSASDCTLELTFHVDFDKATSAMVYATVSSAGERDVLFTDIYKTKVNDEQYISEANMIRGGAIYTTYGNVLLGSIDFKEGANTINFTYDYHSTADFNSWTTNFRSITIESDANVSLTEPPHTCGHICEVCGKCQDPECPFSACKDKCTCEKQKFTFLAIDGDVNGHCVANQIDEIVTLDPTYGYGYVKFVFNAEKAGSGILALTISRHASESWVIADYFRIWVNKGDDTAYKNDDRTDILPKGQYTAKTIVGDTSTYDTINVGLVNLVEGENTIVVGWTAVNQEKYLFNLKDIQLSTINNTLTAIEP